MILTTISTEFLQVNEGYTTKYVPNERRNSKGPYTTKVDMLRNTIWKEDGCSFETNDWNRRINLLDKKLSLLKGWLRNSIECALAPTKTPRYILMRTALLFRRGALRALSCLSNLLNMHWWLNNLYAYLISNCLNAVCFLAPTNWSNQRCSYGMRIFYISNACEKSERAGLISNC